MFTIDTTITDLDLGRKDLLRVLFSMNVHQVANPEMSLEDACSYVFFVREQGKIRAFVGLYFISTDRRMFYSCTENPFSQDALADVEADARSFAEGLGAMLDEIDFSRLPDEEKLRWIGEQEFLSGRKKENGPPPAAPPEGKADAQSAVQQQAPAQPAAQPEPVASAEGAGVLRPVPGAPEPPAHQAAAPGPAQATIQPLAPPDPVAPAEGAVTGHPAPAVSLPPARHDAAAESAPEPQSSPVPSRPSQTAPNTAPPLRSSASPVTRRPVPNAGSAQHAPQADSVEPAARERQEVSAQYAEVVLEEAVKAGVVRTPSAGLKKDIRRAGGLISREKEAMARLLASF